MNLTTYFWYLFLIAGSTYLIRALPFALFTKKIENRFVRSFLYYVPYAVLSAMTIPAIFYSTGALKSALAGLAAALLLAFFNKGLLTVAVGASAAALIAEIALKYIG